MTRFVWPYDDRSCYYAIRPNLILQKLGGGISSRVGLPQNIVLSIQKFVDIKMTFKAKIYHKLHQYYNAPNWSEVVIREL